MVLVAVLAGVLMVPQLNNSSPSPAKNGAPAKPRGIVRAKLTLEQFTQPATGDVELLISSAGPQVNRPDQVTGTPIVWLRCFDRAGKMVARYPYDWPLLEEPGYPPHIHHRGTRQLLRRVHRCQVTGRGVDFDGTVNGRLPVSQ